ncbi:MAG: PD40 domain-containing protein [Deltaproteobacteria bacterium]|nr:PD40 domain-containing protein [Deltaproteobacteria bacterium]
MKRVKLRTLFFIAVMLFTIPGISSASTGNDSTLLVSRPAVNDNHIAFVYGEDLWVADINGSQIRRLTDGGGIETNPAFSPDGTVIAFSATRHGNTDVYLVPSDGGIPQRLTWHPGKDNVQGFTPDGTAVIFSSPRATFTPYYYQLFTVSVTGGVPHRLPIPNAYHASYSPDGAAMAYNPLPGVFFDVWKAYRGGALSEIWLYTFGNLSIVKIPQSDGDCNDVNPLWVENMIYFRSDRNGEFNLFSYNTQSKEIKQLTRHDDFPVQSISAGGGHIVYEQGGTLHRFDPAMGNTVKIDMTVKGDLPEVHQRYVKGANLVPSASVSPSGARAAFEMRGDIVTVPEKKGDPRNITATPGVNERSPVWSPDGKSIAYFSDASGEYELYVSNQDGKGTPRIFRIKGAGFYDRPVWSPDGRHISFTDNSWSLYVLEVKTGKVKKIASEYRYGAIKTLDSSWSPDSRWIAYTLYTKANMQQAFVYSLKKGVSSAVTDGMSDVTSPVFDENGRYLYFIGSTDAGPRRQWFDQSNNDMRINSSLYLAVLKKGIPSPFAKESDEEQGPATKKRAKERKAVKPSPAEVSIDFEGLNNRILAFPLPADRYEMLQPGPAGNIFYMKDGTDGKKTLCSYDVSVRTEETMLRNIDGYLLAADKKKILYRSDKTWGIVTVAVDMEAGTGIINTASVDILLDPRAEWSQMFTEAWRINRDYFYDPGMHGTDWNAVREKYTAFLPALTCRSDLNRVLSWMLSEMSVGHHYVRGGDFYRQGGTITVGLLGADYTIDEERYRFSKVLGGLNWNPKLRSPLTEPGVDVQAGDYILKVNGGDLTADMNLYRLFENTAGKIVELVVGPRADGKEARTVSVVPVGDESALRHRDWVEGNVRRVTEATNGRVAYVHVPDTAISGHDYFKRYFFPQSDRDAIIVDDRFNRGGQYADYYVEMLTRQEIAYFTTRYGASIRVPQAYIPGPKLLLINEFSFSGGDFFPWIFNKLKLGTIVGKRTGGGLVGTLGYPLLMDGGLITAPDFGAWDDDTWIVENMGVPPDVEVEQLPVLMTGGRDPQLEKAIEIALEELKKYPPERRTHPPFPVKNR